MIWNFFKDPLSGMRQFLTNERPLKMMKDAFYFMLKDLFILEIFTLLFWFFGYVKNGLIRKLWLISKFMTSQTGQQVISIHVLPNFSSTKGNQATKFGQLIKFTVRDIFLKKSCRKWGMETNSRTLFVKFI